MCIECSKWVKCFADILVLFSETLTYSDILPQVLFLCAMMRHVFSRGWGMLLQPSVCAAVTCKWAISYLGDRVGMLTSSTVQHKHCQIKCSCFFIFFPRARLTICSTPQKRISEFSWPRMAQVLAIPGTSRCWHYQTAFQRPQARETDWKHPWYVDR